ncbi:MAG: HNH endonuclease family protein [Candidatus Saccharimonadales bacterium]
MLVVFAASLVIACIGIYSQLAVPGPTAPSEQQAQSPVNIPGQTLGSDKLVSAAVALETLAVKGRAPKTGYERSQFGNGWKSVSGCDMRNRILQRDLQNPVFVESNPCLIASGTLFDPYTAKTINFVRGNNTSNDVQIDHVVALSNAWQTGAQQLTPEQREQLANDPLELLAVDGPANQAKGDGDAATWLPPNKSFRCQYVARQVAVKQKYSLWVTQAEKNTIKNILATCPHQSLPSP